MAILVDHIGHMVSDTSLDELHNFAQGMGLKREWFQAHPLHPHYDLTTSRAMDRAIRCGATLVDPATLVVALRKAGYIRHRRSNPPHLSATE